MSESKHTPGPWTIVNIGYPKDKELWVCIGQDVIAKISNTKIDTQAEANARIIAAAPALLAACKTVRATFVGYVQGSIGGQAIEKVNAAIELAEKEE